MRDGCIFKTVTITNYTSNQTVICEESELLKSGIQQAIIHMLERIKDFISDRELYIDGP